MGRRHQYWPWRSWLFGLVGLLFFPAIFLAASGAPFTVGVVANLAFYSIAHWPVVMLHECAHAGVAKLCGLNVFRVRVGSGGIIAKIEMATVPVEVCAIPFGGTTFVAPETARLVRARLALTIAAGPVANAGLAWLAWVVNGGDFVVQTGEFDPLAMWALANAIGAANLLPFALSTHHGRVSSDGLRLLTLPFAKEDQVRDLSSSSRYAEAFFAFGDANYAKAKRLAEGMTAPDPRKEMMRAFLQIHDTRFAEARELLCKLRDEVAGEGERLAVDNGILWAGLYLGDEHTNEALELSSQLLVRAGWASWSAGGRGAALVKSGRPSEGLPFLRRALERATSVAERAELHCWVAAAHSLLGSVDQASWHCTMAVDLDPSCHALGILGDRSSDAATRAHQGGR